MSATNSRGGRGGGAGNGDGAGGGGGDQGPNALSPEDHEELLREARAAWEARGNDPASFSLDKMISLWQKDDKEATGMHVLEKRRRIRRLAPKRGANLGEREVSLISLDFLGHVGRNVKVGRLGARQAWQRQAVDQLLLGYARLFEHEALQEAQRGEAARRVRARCKAANEEKRKVQQRAEKVIQESSKRDTMNQEAVAASREEARLARAQRQAEQQERRRLEMERAAAEQRAEEEAQRADQRAARVVGFRALAAAAGVEAAQRKAANEAETEARRAAQERELEREAPAVAAAEDWERDAVPEIDASVAPSLRFPSEQPKASTRPRPVTMGGTAGAAASSQVRVEVVEDEGSPTEVGPSLHTGGEEGRGGKLSRSLFAPPMPRAAPFAQEEVRVEGDAPTAPSSGTGLMDAEAVPTRPVRLRMDLERARSLETRAHSLHRAAVEQDSALQEALGLVGGQKRRLSARVDQLLLMDRELNDLLAGPPQRQPRPEERDALHARRHERLALRERLKVMDQREARLRQDATRARATMQQAAGEVEKRREETRRLSESIRADTARRRGAGQEALAARRTLAAADSASYGVEEGLPVVVGVSLQEVVPEASPRRLDPRLVEATTRFELARTAIDHALRVQQSLRRDQMELWRARQRKRLLETEVKMQERRAADIREAIDDTLKSDNREHLVAAIRMWFRVGYKLQPAFPDRSGTIRWLDVADTTEAGGAGSGSGVSEQPAPHPTGSGDAGSARPESPPALPPLELPQRRPSSLASRAEAAPAVHETDERGSVRMGSCLYATLRAEISFPRKSRWRLRFVIESSSRTDRVRGPRRGTQDAAGSGAAGSAAASERSGGSQATARSTATDRSAGAGSMGGMSDVTGVTGVTAARARAGPADPEHSITVTLGPTWEQAERVGQYFNRPEPGREVAFHDVVAEVEASRVVIALHWSASSLAAEDHLVVRPLAFQEEVEDRMQLVDPERGVYLSDFVRRERERRSRGVSGRGALLLSELVRVEDLVKQHRAFLAVHDRAALRALDGQLKEGAAAGMRGLQKDAARARAEELGAQPTTPTSRSTAQESTTTAGDADGAAGKGNSKAERRKRRRSGDARALRRERATGKAARRGGSGSGAAAGAAAGAKIVPSGARGAREAARAQRVAEARRRAAYQQKAARGQATGGLIVSDKGELLVDSRVLHGSLQRYRVPVLLQGLKLELADLNERARRGGTAVEQAERQWQGLKEVEEAEAAKAEADREAVESTLRGERGVPREERVQRSRRNYARRKRRHAIKEITEGRALVGRSVELFSPELDRWRLAEVISARARWRDDTVLDIEHQLVYDSDVEPDPREGGAKTRPSIRAAASGVRLANRLRRASTRSAMLSPVTRRGSLTSGAGSAMERLDASSGGLDAARSGARRLQRQQAEKGRRVAQAPREKGQAAGTPSGLQGAFRYSKRRRRSTVVAQGSTAEGPGTPHDAGSAMMPGPNGSVLDMDRVARRRERVRRARAEGGGSSSPRQQGSPPLPEWYRSADMSPSRAGAASPTESGSGGRQERGELPRLELSREDSSDSLVSADAGASPPVSGRGSPPKRRGSAIGSLRTRLLRERNRRKPKLYWVDLRRVKMGVVPVDEVARVRTAYRRQRAGRLRAAERRREALAGSTYAAPSTPQGSGVASELMVAAQRRRKELAATRDLVGMMGEEVDRLREEWGAWREQREAEAEERAVEQFNAQVALEEQMAEADEMFEEEVLSARVQVLCDALEAAREELDAPEREEELAAVAPILVSDVALGHNAPDGKPRILTVDEAFQLAGDIFVESEVRRVEKEFQREWRPRVRAHGQAMEARAAQIQRRSQRWEREERWRRKQEEAEEEVQFAHKWRTALRTHTRIQGFEKVLPPQIGCSHARSRRWSGVYGTGVRCMDCGAELDHVQADQAEARQKAARFWEWKRGQSEGGGGEGGGAGGAVVATGGGARRGSGAGAASSGFKLPASAYAMEMGDAVPRGAEAVQLRLVADEETRRLEKEHLEVAEVTSVFADARLPSHRIHMLQRHGGTGSMPRVDALGVPLTAKSPGADAASLPKPQPEATLVRAVRRVTPQRATQEEKDRARLRLKLAEGMAQEDRDVLLARPALRYRIDLERRQAAHEDLLTQFMRIRTYSERVKALEQDLQVLRTGERSRAQELVSLHASLRAHRRLEEETAREHAKAESMLQRRQSARAVWERAYGALTDGASSLEAARVEYAAAETSALMEEERLRAARSQLRELRKWRHRADADASQKAERAESARGELVQHHYDTYNARQALLSTQFMRPGTIAHTPFGSSVVMGQRTRDRTLIVRLPWGASAQGTRLYAHVDTVLERAAVVENEERAQMGVEDALSKRYRDEERRRVKREQEQMAAEEVAMREQLLLEALHRAEEREKEMAMRLAGENAQLILDSEEVKGDMKEDAAEMADEQRANAKRLRFDKYKKDEQSSEIVWLLEAAASPRITRAWRKRQARLREFGRRRGEFVNQQMDVAEGQMVEKQEQRREQMRRDRVLLGVLDQAVTGVLLREIADECLREGMQHKSRAQRESGLLIPHPAHMQYTPYRASATQWRQRAMDLRAALRAAGKETDMERDERLRKEHRRKVVLARREWARRGLASADFSLEAFEAVVAEERRQEELRREREAEERRAMGEAEQEMRAYEHALLMRHLRERWGMRDEDLRSRAMREEEEAALNAAGAKSYRVGRYEEARKGTRGSGALQRRQQLQARVKEQQRVEREHQQAVAEDELAHRRRDVERREEQMAMLERERQKFMASAMSDSDDDAEYEDSDSDASESGLDSSDLSGTDEDIPPTAKSAHWFAGFELDGEVEYPEPERWSKRFLRRRAQRSQFRKMTRSAVRLARHTRRVVGDLCLAELRAVRAEEEVRVVEQESVIAQDNADRVLKQARIKTRESLRLAQKARAKRRHALRAGSAVVRAARAVERARHVEAHARRAHATAERQTAYFDSAVISGMVQRYETEASCSKLQNLFFRRIVEGCAMRAVGVSVERTRRSAVTQMKTLVAEKAEKEGSSARLLRELRREERLRTRRSALHCQGYFPRLARRQLRWALESWHMAVAWSHGIKASFHLKYQLKKQENALAAEWAGRDDRAAGQLEPPSPQDMAAGCGPSVDIPQRAETLLRGLVRHGQGAAAGADADAQRQVLDTLRGARSPRGMASLLRGSGAVPAAPSRRPDPGVGSKAAQHAMDWARQGVPERAFLTPMQELSQRPVRCRFCRKEFAMAANHSRACPYHPGQYHLSCPSYCKEFTASCGAHYRYRWSCCDSTGPSPYGEGGCATRAHEPQGEDDPAIGPPAAAARREEEAAIDRDARETEALEAARRRARKTQQAQLDDMASWLDQERSFVERYAYLAPDTK